MSFCERENTLLKAYFSSYIFYIGMFLFSIVNVDENIGGRLSLPISTCCTAVVFFRKFYTRSSLLEFDPRRISITALVLAAKVVVCILFIYVLFHFFLSHKYHTSLYFVSNF